MDKDKPKERGRVMEEGARQRERNKNTKDGKKRKCKKKETMVKSKWRNIHIIMND